MEHTKRKHILFVTTANLATNPRLVKEINSALVLKMKVTVVTFSFTNWSNGINEQLKNNFSDAVEMIEIPAGRTPVIPWLMSSLVQKISSFLLQYFTGYPGLLAASLNKRSWLLMKALKKTDNRPDIVIAHNPGSFYPAMKFAKQKNSLLGIDVEDYHPGENHDPKVASIMKKLMQLVLPVADYCSYASPLIMEEVKKDVKGLKNNQLVILNGFNGDEFIQPLPVEQDAIQLVWFSQNIDVNRGLENVIPVVNELYPLVELHLIGNLKPAFEAAFLQNKTGIILHPPKSQKELHQFLSTCDVGLALEPGKDLNNTLAISNKLIAYVQAGLFIAATHTLAQDEFLVKSRLDFEQVEDQTSSFKSLLQRLCYKKTELRKKKAERFVTGREYDWQQIAKPLLNVWVKK